MTEARFLRSILFVPGHQGERIAKAARSGADAIMIDLEDAVPASHKAAARGVTRESIAALGTGAPAVFVRLNGWGEGSMLADLDAIVAANLHGVALPKCDGPGQVVALDLVLGDLERSRSLPPGAIEILPMLETAAGMRRNFEVLQCSPRVRRAGGVVGAAPGGDYHRALGNEWSPEGLESLYVNSRVVLDARAAGLDNIICGPVTDVGDEALLRNVMTAARRIGANGALAIHPRQVPIINGIFSPSPERIAEAVAVLRAMDAAVREGKAAVVLDGKMIDYAHVRWANLLLERARSMGIDAGDVPRITPPAP
ncbi:MAG: CoA ester lyase [Gammaproteobacteria bacterium]